MDPTRAYVVCSTPRSGSTYLCELLASTGVAGRPEEYFEARADTGVPPHPGEYLQGLPRTGAGIRDDSTPPEAPAYSDLRGLEGYREHLERTRRLGTTPNGVFGCKLMWRQVADLRTLASGLPEYGHLDLYQLLTRVLGDPVFVWATRRDKVRQAISLWRALQTRTWRLESPADDGGPEKLSYSFEGIDHLAQFLQTDDDAWQRYFEAHALAPVTIVYEDDLEPDREGSVRRVLESVGVELPPGWRPAARMVRQSDELNEEWNAAYHRDAALRLVR